jgi:hypothetical protein
LTTNKNPISILVMMLFLSAALLAAIGLVGKNQENRSLAAGLNSSCIGIIVEGIVSGQLI